MSGRIAQLEKSVADLTMAFHLFVPFALRHIASDLDHDPDTIATALDRLAAQTPGNPFVAEIAANMRGYAEGLARLREPPLRVIDGGLPDDAA